MCPEHAGAQVWKLHAWLASQLETLRAELEALPGPRIGLHIRQPGTTAVQARGLAAARAAGRDRAQSSTVLTERSHDVQSGGITYWIRASGSAAVRPCSGASADRRPLRAAARVCRPRLQSSITSSTGGLPMASTLTEAAGAAQKHLAIPPQEYINRFLAAFPDVKVRPTLLQH